MRRSTPCRNGQPGSSPRSRLIHAQSTAVSHTKSVCVRNRSDTATRERRQRRKTKDPVMNSAIRPVSLVSPQLVKEYLTNLGESEAMVEWKYFDDRFNKGRERGYVWMNSGRVGGFIGLIPFRIIHNHRELTAAWSCDWSLDWRMRPGIGGVLMVREALRSYDLILSSGGNDKTRRIFSQIALTTSTNAGLSLHAPMRLGFVLQLLRCKLGSPFLDRMQRVSHFPLRTTGRRSMRCEVRTEPGVSRAIIPLLEHRSSMEDCPSYDFEYLHWQVGRCPKLESYTMYVDGAAGVRTALLLWCSTASRDFWRMALLTSEAGRDELDSVVTTALSYVYAQGGVVLSVGASRHETNLIKALRAHGFLVSPRRRPLYILSHHRGRGMIPEVQQSSYIDTDWAYRLPVPHMNTTAQTTIPTGG